MARDALTVIVGGGIAGWAAASQLGQARRPVLIMEARSRLGGRILTQRDPICDYPIELGAEFIHGLPPEIWGPLQNSKTEITEVDGQTWCNSEQGLSPCDFFSQVDSILEEMDDSQPDESFLSFLERRFPNPTDDPRREVAKQRAVRYVCGFHAADPKLVGVHWLVRSMRAEEVIEGNRTFRSKHGYGDLLETFQRKITEYDVQAQTSTVVEGISWAPGRVEVLARGPGGAFIFPAANVLITLPLSILKSPVGQFGAIRFTPPLPRHKTDSLEKLEMGEIVRVVLRFRHRFWDAIAPQVSNHRTLSDMSFLLSQDEWFPTWWTTMPEKVPILTAWAPFPSARRLSVETDSSVIDASLKTLARLLGVSLEELTDGLDNAYFHNWQSDPFSRGAYSYGKAGASGAQQVLAAPIADTLFFAGEAVDTTGHNGTVHGAIASGYRAAAEILSS